MELKIEGKVIFIGALQTGVSQAGKEWQKRDFVIETQERYSRKCAFTLFGGEKIEAAKMVVGDMLEVKFDIESREYNGRWYTQLNAYAVNNLSDPTAQMAGQATAQPRPASDADDDIPF